MRKQREVLPPASGVLAAWGLARSLATSSNASATPPKRGTRHQWCQCWHKMYQTMLSPGTPTLAAVAALWLPCAIETTVNAVESPGRRSGRRIAPLEKVGRRRRSHAHHDEPDLGVVDPPSIRLDPVKENRIWSWRQRIRSRDDGFGGERTPGIMSLLATIFFQFLVEYISDHLRNCSLFSLDSTAYY
jgi:hypothetical protein